MNKRTRGVTASALARNSNHSAIEAIIKDIIKIIDDKIFSAHRAGFNHIEHELPLNFNINSMDKSDAQTMVYSELITTYIKDERDGGKGFTKTYIELGATPKLHIYWRNGLDEEDRNHRKSIIRAHIAKK